MFAALWLMNHHPGMLRANIWMPFCYCYFSFVGNAICIDIWPNCFDSKNSNGNSQFLHPFYRLKIRRLVFLLTIWLDLVQKICQASSYLRKWYFVRGLIEAVKKPRRSFTKPNQSKNWNLNWHEAVTKK